MPHLHNFIKNFHSFRSLFARYPHSSFAIILSFLFVLLRLKMRPLMNTKWRFDDNFLFLFSFFFVVCFTLLLLYAEQSLDALPDPPHLCVINFFSVGIKRKKGSLDVTRRSCGVQGFIVNESVDKLKLAEKQVIN